jgi:hypothetical protein
MTRNLSATIRLPAALLAAALALPAVAAPAWGDVPADLDGPAYWAAGGPGPDHAARAYPQYAQQQATSPLRFLSVVTLKQRLEAGERPAIIDVRTPEEYLRQRIAGAVNIPLDQIDKRLDEIPRQGTVVLY